MVRVFAVTFGQASQPWMKHLADRISSSRSLLIQGPWIVCISPTVIANRPCQRCPYPRAENAGSNPVSCQQTIQGMDGESAQLDGRFREAWIATTSE